MTTQEKWWWVLTLKEGKNYLLGPYHSDAQAVSKARLFGAEKFRLYELATIDDTRASKMVKERRMETTNYGRS